MESTTPTICAQCITGDSWRTSVKVNCVRADQQQIKNFAKEHNGIELFDIEETQFTLR